MILMIFSTVLAPHEPAFTVESFALSAAGRVIRRAPAAARSGAARIVRGLREGGRMYETEAELDELQDLLDSSLSLATDHLRSIITGERTLTARQLTAVITGMCTLSIATVTARGEPRISAVDGHFLHGPWVFGTARSAANARQLP